MSVYGPVNGVHSIIEESSMTFSNAGGHWEWSSEGLSTIFPSPKSFLDRDHVAMVCMHPFYAFFLIKFLTYIIFFSFFAFSFLLHLFHFVSLHFGQKFATTARSSIIFFSFGA